MSPSDLLRETGLKVSTRQFRRYMAGGVIPGIVRSKGGHFSVVGPVTQTRLSVIRKRVLKFRCKPGRKKLNYVPPVETKKRSADGRSVSRIEPARHHARIRVVDEQM